MSEEWIVFFSKFLGFGWTLVIGLVGVVVLSSIGVLLFHFWNWLMDDGQWQMRILYILIGCVVMVAVYYVSDYFNLDSIFYEELSRMNKS